MSVFIDLKYTHLLATRLEQFKVKNNNPFTANCRCPICGDSKRNKWKARGYIFTRKGSLFFKCHNCNYGSSLGFLIKELDPTLYHQYSLEVYKEGGNQKPHANVTSVMSFSPPNFEARKKENVLDHLLDKVYGTPAEEYLRKRKIPESRWRDLYYIDNMQKMEQLSEKYKDRIVGEEGRLVIPFYDRDGNFVGVTCRALGSERLRYVTVRVNDERPFVFNLDKVDITKKVYVTEGPLDSLFLQNAVAAGSSDLNSIAAHIPKNKIVLIFDNQPRNTEIVKIIEKAIHNGFSMVIWPENIKEKDINDMILNDIKVEEIINEHTYQGLELNLQFSKWKKI